ncbi:MAG: helix-turn-helix domain-containing protein [Pseudomonadota bacterium]|jgi:CRP-like cAMP-binding protein
MHIEAATRSQSVNRAPLYPYAPDQSAQTLFGSVELAGARMSFAKDVEIYGEHEPADYVYKVLTGTVRVYKILQDGRRQIEAFYFPGDVFGMELGSHHASSAEAVSAATIAVVRRSALMAAAAKDADVSNRLWAHTAHELEQARRHAMLLVKTAQERVASFLIDISNRYNGEAVELPMSRQDIADYLGLTIETVSRTLTQFQQTAAIELATSRRMILRNRQALINLDS